MSSQSSEPTQVGQVNDGPVCPVAVDKLVPIEESKIAFPNFTWNKWIAWNYHATKEKERINGYCCNRTYSTQCRTTFEKRATKATLYGKHNHFHMVSRFIFVRRTVFEDDERVMKDKEKIAILVNALKHSNNLPTNGVQNGVWRIIVCLSGDSKYLKGIKYMNEILSEMELPTICVGLSGKKGKCDPIHEDENANKVGFKDKGATCLIIDSLKLSKTLSKSLRFPKKVKLRREIARRGLTFTIAPDERYMTHAHRQNIVFDKFYNEVIYIMELAEMQQVEATRTSQYVIAIGGMLDFFEGAIVFKLSFLQKSQMYRGDVTAQDDKAYNWMSQMMQDRKAFVTFAKAWKQERSECVEPLHCIVICDEQMESKYEIDYPQRKVCGKVYHIKGIHQSNDKTKIFEDTGISDLMNPYTLC
eukprot:574652_1